MTAFELEICVHLLELERHSLRLSDSKCANKYIFYICYTTPFVTTH